MTKFFLFIQYNIYSIYLNGAELIMSLLIEVPDETKITDNWKNYINHNTNDIYKLISETGLNLVNLDGDDRISNSNRWRFLGQFHDYSKVFEYFDENINSCKSKDISIAYHVIIYRLYNNIIDYLPEYILSDLNNIIAEYYGFELLWSHELIWNCESKHMDKFN